MGKQVRFYMHEDDRSAFGAYLAAIANAAVAPWIFPTAKVPVLRPDNIKYELPQYYVFNAESLDEIRTTEVAGRWMVDLTRSEAVEWGLSIRRDNQLSQGRLFFRTSYVVDSAVKMKHPEFVTWADALCGWIRREFSLRKELSAYVGPNAARWEAAGGVLAV